MKGAVGEGIEPSGSGYPFPGFPLFSATATRRCVCLFHHPTVSKHYLLKNLLKQR